MNIHVRKAEKNDLKYIGDLLYQVNKVHSDARPDIFKSGARKYNDEEILAIISNESTPVFVATDGDKVVGYVFCISKQFVNDNNMTDIKTLYIDDLCVDENYRKRGIGRTLVEYAFEYAKSSGYYNVTLNVWADNKNAVEFYKNLGLSVQKTVLEKIIKRD